MALLDVLGGQESGSGRVPPLAKGLAALLAYSKLKKPGDEGPASARSPDYAEELEEIFKPSPTGGPTAKGVIGALLTGGMMDLVRQFRGADKGEAMDSWIAPGPVRSLALVQPMMVFVDMPGASKTCCRLTASIASQSSKSTG